MSGARDRHPRELLSEYLDDELSVEVRTSIDRHLAGCEDCRAELDALRQLRKAVAGEEVPPVPLDLVARIGRSLDAEMSERPRRRRFVLPTTIAATIAAVGILVALQWREGRLNRPADRAPEVLAPTLDERRDMNARPSLPAAPPTVTPQEKKEAAGSETLDKFRKDVGRVDESAADDRRKQDRPEFAPTQSVEGVLGGASRQAEPVDERRDREASEDAQHANEAAGLAAPTAPTAKTAAAAPLAKAMPPPAAAQAEAVSRCVERWSDSGLHGTWDVTDLRSAAQELSRTAEDFGGIGSWRGALDGRPYVVVVPRDRFVELVVALRARGVTGLPEAPTIEAGADCAAVSVALNLVAPSVRPTPR